MSGVLKVASVVWKVAMPAEVFEIIEARLRERRGIVERALGLIVPV